MASLVGAKAIAQLFELSERRIRELAKQGIIPKPSRGKYDLLGCVRGYIRFLKSRSIATALGTDDIYHERARLLKAQADDKEMTVAERRRELVQIQAAVDLLQVVIQNSRAKMLAVPVKLAPQLIALDTAAAAQAIVETEIHGVLHELAELDVAALGGESNARAMAPPGKASGQ